MFSAQLSYWSEAYLRRSTIRATQYRPRPVEFCLPVACDPGLSSGGEPVLEARFPMICGGRSLHRSRRPLKRLGTSRDATYPLTYPDHGMKRSFLSIWAESRWQTPAVETDPASLLQTVVLVVVRPT